jgi:3,4-dihydroxy 2-butanone 4-phosphate synthase/GTP cyclohydrolase II
VTLSYAQSIDGCLTVRRGLPFAISGEESLRVTHTLRSLHDAILVGVGTVLADNPRLNVRFVDGPDPRPVVLDSHLRIPLDSKLLARSDNLPWIACGPNADEEKWDALDQRKVRVLTCRQNHEKQIDLEDLLAQLYESGIRSVMVEGGAGVITGFLTAQLVDLAVITVAPVWLGGLRVVERELPGEARLRLDNPQSGWFGRDMVLWGSVQRSNK